MNYKYYINFIVLLMLFKFDISAGLKGAISLDSWTFDKVRYFVIHSHILFLNRL